MIDVLKTNQCVLCRACVTACPTGAITFDRENGSFRYPVIDKEKCVGCEKCARVCPVLNPPVGEPKEPESRVAVSRDEASRLASTSGGVFYEAAKYVLSIGGYVCGAVFTEDFSVRHVVTDDPAVVETMRGSKYVQSDMTGTYAEIARLLKDGKPVLFCACPCQAAALRTYLGGKTYPGLWVLDIICHGIPSDEMWHTYLSVQEKKYGAPVTSVCFRSKELGWHRSSVRLTFANGKKYLCPYTDDFYTKGLIRNIVLKESCYECPFRGYRSGSDLTLGDFWGAEAALPGKDDNKGMSVLLTHTDAGRELLSHLSLDLYDVPLGTVVNGNRNLLESPPVHPDRAPYYRVRAEKGEAAAMKKYLMETPAQKLKRVTMYRLRRIKHRLQGKKTLY